MTERIKNVNQIEWGDDPRFPGVSLQLLISRDHTPAVSMLRVFVEEGAEITTHVHPTETEIIYVLAGQPVLTMQGTRHQLSAGGFAVIPSGIEHSLDNPNAETVELMAIHSPPTR
ncbi:MAG: cupin domain-containing protein [Aggregatilineales bacterium]